MVRPEAWAASARRIPSARPAQGSPHNVREGEFRALGLPLSPRASVRPWREGGRERDRERDRSDLERVCMCEKVGECLYLRVCVSCHCVCVCLTVCVCMCGLPLLGGRDAHPTFCPDGRRSIPGLISLSACIGRALERERECECECPHCVHLGHRKKEREFELSDPTAICSALICSTDPSYLDPLSGPFITFICSTLQFPLTIPSPCTDPLYTDGHHHPSETPID